MNTSTTTKEYTSRDEIPEEYKWDLTKIYPNWEAWEADIEKVELLIQKVEALKGTFNQGPEVILQWQELENEIQQRCHKINRFTTLHLDTDLKNEDYAIRKSKSEDLENHVKVRLAWAAPELLSIPRETIIKWIDGEPKLQAYKFILLEPYRLQEYTLPEHIEKQLNNFSYLNEGAESIYSSLTQECRYIPEIDLTDGTKLKLTPTVYSSFMEEHPNPDDRYIAATANSKKFIEHKSSFASLYDLVCRSTFAQAKSRNYASALEAYLEERKIPLEIVENFLHTGKKSAPIMLRYRNLRQRVLGLKTYRSSDQSIPLSKAKTGIRFSEAKKIAIESVGIFGKEYQTEYASMFENRQIDVYPHPHKATGAYNCSMYGMQPFVKLNYEETMFGQIMLAHEMGHAMHSILEEKVQPFGCSHSTILVAEVASHIGERLYQDQLVKHINNKDQQIAFIEKQINDIYRSFVIQLFFASYEIKTHKASEKGEMLTASKLTQIYRESYTEYLGKAFPEEEYINYIWTRNFFFYKLPFYEINFPLSCAATSVIHAKMRHASTEAERQKTVDQYLDMLRSGGSDYPINQIKKAGVDLTKPDATERVIKELDRLVTELESYYPEN